MAEAAPRGLRPRQLRLFQISNPISTRLGAEAFTQLPRCPGVYFFYESTGRLLYIGQSNNLRARVGSYRHVAPERHPRRILRLVHRIAHIEWRTCATAADAIELERTLLLHHRPPFNRAGTWQPPPWLLEVEATPEVLHLRLVRETAEPVRMPPATAPLLFVSPDPNEHLAPAAAGTAPPALPRTVHATVGRCLFRLHHPEAPLSAYPPGLLNLTAPLHLSLPLPGAALACGAMVREFAAGEPAALLEAIRPLAEGVTEEDLDHGTLAAYWATQVEMLENFAAKQRHPVQG